MILLLWLFTVGGQYEAPATPKLWGVAGPDPSARPHRSIEWMQDAPKIEDIYWFIYRVYIDDLPPKLLGPGTCKGTYSPFNCSAPMPDLTTLPGRHRLTLTVSRFKSGDSVQHPSSTGPESPKSNEAEFVVKQPPPFMYIPQATGPNTAPQVPVIIK